MASPTEHSSFLSAQNAAFIGELHDRWQRDPASVDEGWRRFFASLADEGASAVTQPSWAPTDGARPDGDLAALAGLAEAFAIELSVPPAKAERPAAGRPAERPAAPIDADT